MSKIWKKLITIPQGTTVEVKWNHVKVNGPKGSLEYTLLDGVSLDINENQITVVCPDPEKRNFRGLTRTLVDNMIEWVSKGYQKKLMVLGVWYTAKVQGKEIIFTLWFSHPVKVEIPASLTVTVEKDAKSNDILTISGIDKQFLGQYVANIRALKAPEPYKGKGIRYLDETIKLKAGKTAKK